MKLKQKKYIGIIGSGFIAKGLMYALQYDPYLEVSKVLTRRDFDKVEKLPVKKNQLTHNISDVIRNSDLVVEATGDVLYATETVEHVLLSGLPVVTMNAELQLTTGSMLSRLGTLIEAEGDQPGTLAALDTEVKSMGFKPLVYGNIKGFLNLNPPKEDMEYWAKRQGIRLDKVTAFTDGTKVEIEQALVANGLGATISKKGMKAIACNSFEDGAETLAKSARRQGAVLSDYVVCGGAPAGVFIVATHDKSQIPYLNYLKLGSGPFYTIIKPYHLCHLEISKTIRHVLTNSSTYTFNNGTSPTVQVVAVAKKDLKPGETIAHGIGSFKVRGQASLIDDSRKAVPIGLMDNVVIEKPIKAGKVIQTDQITMPYSRAKELWEALMYEKYQVASTKAQPRKNRVTPLGSRNSSLWYHFLRNSKTNQRITRLKA